MLSRHKVDVLRWRRDEIGRPHEEVVSTHLGPLVLLVPTGDGREHPARAGVGT
jgi:hypothetical protein